MTKKMLVFTLCAGILLPISSAAQAQPREPFGPPDGGPGFGGESGGRRPGGRRPGDKGGLIRVWRGIDRLEKDGPALSEPQAKRVVALVLPWSKKPQMTPTQGREVRQKLTAILTTAQKTALDGDRPGFGPRPDAPMFGRPPRDGRGEDDGAPRGGGGRGPNGRGPRGPRLNLSESQRGAVRAWLEKSNPFYAPTGTSGWKSLPVEFQKDASRRYQENRALLEKLSRKSR